MTASGDPGPPVYWKAPPDDGRADRDEPSLRIRVLIGVGVGLLWMAGLLILFVNTYGDCFGSEAACQQAWVLASQRAETMALLLGLLTASAIAAYIKVGRRSLGVLLVTSLVASALVIVDVLTEPYSIPYMPAGLVFIAPALLCLVVASVVGLVRPTGHPAGGGR